MSDIIIEIIRAAITSVIFIYLLHVGKKEAIRQQNGWTCIIAGFALILFGMVIDISDNFPSMNKYIIIGDTAYEAFLEKVIGYLFGFLLLAIGFVRWMPIVIALKQTESALKSSRDKLEIKVEQRTSHLRSLNEQFEQEIIDRKRAEDALKGSEKYLAKAQEIAHIGHWKLDPKTNEVTGSDELYRIFGLSREESTFESFVEAVHPEDREFDVATIRRGIEYGEDWNIEHRLICGDGTQKWIQAIGETITDEKGKTVSLVGTCQDITKRKQVEEAIRLQSEIIGNMAEGVNLVRLCDVTIVYTNPKFDEIFGYDRGELIEKHVSVLNAGNKESHEKVVAEVIVSLNETGVWQGEIENIKKDGTHFWCYCNVSTFQHHEHGEVCISVQTDITERKKATEDATRFNRVLEHSLNEIFIFDAETLHFVEVNRGARENLGYSMEELCGFTPLDLKPEFTAEQFSELVAPLRNGEREIVQFSTVHRRKDETLYPVDVYLQLMSEGSPSSSLSSSTSPSANWWRRLCYGRQKN